MREEAPDPTLIVDDLLGPEPSSPAAPAPASRPPTPEPSDLRELLDWVSNEVFGQAEG